MTSTPVVTPYRILVTGWRHWPVDHAFVIEQALDAAAWNLSLTGGSRPIIVVHGHCPHGGVDRYAHRWAEQHPHAQPEPHPADRGTDGRILGPARNTTMVNLGANLCLAFPGPRSRGTWDCSRKAVDADIPTEFTAWCSIWSDQWAEVADQVGSR